MAEKNNAMAETVPAEKTTKERIFEAALDLFAQKGYDAVSMREIAEAVGIKKASLYSHFTSKEQLLENILEYPMARMSNVGPQGIDSEKMILDMGVDSYMAMASGVFNEWIASPEMEKIWRVICIELYHNGPMKKFYDRFMSLAIAFWRSNFSIMIKHRLIKRLDADALAREYLSFYLYAFMDYFIVNYGAAGSFLDVEGQKLDEHMAFLVESIKV